MKSTSTTTSNEAGLDAVSKTSTNGDGKLGLSRSRVTTLKELSLRLLREVQSIGDVRTLSLDNGLDFYEEVGRFEVDLIKLALLQTGGHQRRAARLLNLKVTTLNSKIKHYHICLDDFDNSCPIVLPRIESRQFA